jgi:hypothetical protein
VRAKNSLFISIRTARFLACLLHAHSAIFDSMKSEVAERELNSAFVERPITPEQLKAATVAIAENPSQA